jgi:predicted ATPase
MTAEFDTLSSEFQEVLQQAQSQHKIQVTPLQELKGGQTGARLYLTSVAQTSSNRVEHMILKLDRVNPKARAGEMELHQQVLQSSPPDFARDHIPGFPFAAVKAGEAIGIFYSIAGQSLLDFRSLASYTQGRQQEIIFRATNHYLLEEWNSAARFEQGVQPQTLFPTWLSYRLKSGGAIDRFFTDTLKIPANIPGLAIQGQVFPNPFFYARETGPWDKARRMDVLTGMQHGDLNIGNILVKFSANGKKLEGYHLIDFSLFKDNIPLLYDHSYLNLSYLISELERLPFARWLDLVFSLAEGDLPSPNRSPVDSAGAFAVLRAGRAAFDAWVKEQHPTLFDDLWIQYRLAAVAAGLNYCNKPLSDTERLAGLIFAAAHLKPVLARLRLAEPAEIVPLSLPHQAAPGAPPTLVPSLVGHTVQNNLPTAPTPFIGRAEEVSALAAMVLADGVRLVTLTGPGGTGKTRLAVRAAEELLPRFPNGVCFVPLEDVHDPGLVLSTIALRLGLREGNGQPLQDNLRFYLHGKQLLLVLDNFEQVMEAAPVIAGILSMTQHVKLLVTSRAVLNLSGEHEYAVPPMRLPDSAQAVDPESMLKNEAVQLFVQRAQAAQRSFSLTAENAPAVAALCQRLDGLPLAMELAAARVRLLTPQAMVARLGSRLKLLTGGARDLPARQQTLRQAIDWSYTLLNDAEKILFARLAVFVGGWTLESMEAVCNAEGDLADPLPSLDSLLNNSLVRREEGLEGEPRFRMLETIREFALDQLAERGETGKMARLHAAYFAGQCHAIGMRIYSREAQRHLAWIGAENDNLRAALAWCLEPDGEVQSALPILNLAFWFWFRRGYLSEGREWFRRVMEKLPSWPPNPAMTAVLGFSGLLAVWQGDLKSGSELLEAGLQMALVIEDGMLMALCYLGNGIALLNRGSGEKALASLESALSLFQQMKIDFFIANTRIHLGNAALALNDPQGAEASLQQALPIAEQVGEQWLVASILNNQGEVARTRRDYGRAQTYYEKSEALFRKLGDIEDHTRLVHSLGYIALYQGDLDSADQRFHQSLTVFRELGNRRGIAECLAGLARLALLRGEPARSATLLSAALVNLKAGGAAWWPADQVEYQHSLEDLHKALPQDKFDAAWNSGQAMSMEQAIALERRREPG